MKKIGFIDLFIDEWHANNYPKWFAEAPSGKDFTVAAAWEKAPAGGRPLAQWCEEMQIPAAKSLEALLEECDCFCVLAPSNAEVHEELSALPLATGKPVYIDKPFAPDRAAAERIFAAADRSGSPLWSSSALRFGDEWQAALQSADAPEYVGTTGGGRLFSEYCIHQVEMIVQAMGTSVARVLRTSHNGVDHAILEFEDGRTASLTLQMKIPFSATICRQSGEVVSIPTMSNTFLNLIEAMLQFFQTGISPVDRSQTIAIAGVIDALIRAEKTLGSWVNVLR